MNCLCTVMPEILAKGAVCQMRGGGVPKAGDGGEDEELQDGDGTWGRPVMNTHKHKIP